MFFSSFLWIANLVLFPLVCLILYAKVFYPSKIKKFSKEVCNIQVTSLPSLLRLLPMLLVNGFSKKEGVFYPGFKSVPAMQVSISQVKVNEDQLKTYKKLVSFPENEAEIIPSSYPGAVQSLTLIPFILSQPQFPLSPFGLIHIRSEFTIFTKLTIKDLLDFKVFISGHRDTEKGIEFDVITQAFNFMGIKVWELVEVLLSRKKGRSSKKPPPNKLDELPSPTKTQTISVPDNIGWNYAKVSGDYNPHHISHILAKLFGYKKAIAHGMWTLERTLCEIRKESNGQVFIAPYKLTVAFKLPLFFPTSVKLTWTSDPNINPISYQVTSSVGDSPYLIGTIEKLKEENRV